MIEIVIFVFFAINTLYVGVLAIAGRFYSRRQVPVASSFQRIVVLVPCCRADDEIIPTVQHLFTLNYPEEYYDVVVIANTIRPQTVDALSMLGCLVVQTQFEEHLTGRAVNYALQQLPSNHYAIAVVVDADSILSRNFLTTANNLFCAGYTVVQAQRVSRNSDAPAALLHDLREGINNHLFRQGGHVLGLSSSLSGSGMSFPFAVLRTSTADVDSVIVGKELQQVLAKHGHRIYYQKDMLVFDEKTESPEAYGRSLHGINGRYKMLFDNFFKGFGLLVRGNFDFFNQVVCRQLFPSCISGVAWLLLFSVVFTVLYLPHPPVVIRWWAITSFYVLALSIALPKSFYSRRVARSFLSSMVGAFKKVQIVTLWAMANRVFMQTPRKRTSVNVSR